jgi:hypothetical protein
MLSVAITVLILRITNKIGHGQNVATRFYNKTAHLTGAFFAAVEGHLICRYIWPFCYPLVFWIQRHTGIDLTGFEY